jgi:multifunctional 2-oxoglutarate metabolism enzyme
VSGEGLQDDYGANSWLVDEMYQKYRQNPDSVDKEWWPILENYKPSEASASPVAPMPPRRYQFPRKFPTLLLPFL